MFFFEKKNQKTFVFIGYTGAYTRQKSKVFCFFFSKKKCFLLYPVGKQLTVAPGNDEDALIPFSALQHYVVSPRQCALIHREQIWAEDAATAAGRQRGADVGYLRRKSLPA